MRLVGDDVLCKGLKTMAPINIEWCKTFLKISSVNYVFLNVLNNTVIFVQLTNWTSLLV